MLDHNNETRTAGQSSLKSALLKRSDATKRSLPIAKNFDADELIFQQGAFWCGTEWLPNGTKFIAQMPTMMHGWRLWKDGRLVEHSMSLLSDGYKAPPYDTAEMRVERCASLQMRNVKSGRRYTFIATDEHSNNALRELSRIYGDRRGRNPNTSEVPIVELGWQDASVALFVHGEPNLALPKFKLVGWAGGHKVRSTRIKIDSDGMLPCPCCGELCGLHHEGIDVFGREEDAEYVTKTEVTSTQLNVSHIKNIGSGNPSARRHGLVIHFYCEHCGDGIELALAQHKGHSLLEWRLPQ